MKKLVGLKSTLQEDDGVDILQDNIRLTSDYSSKIMFPNTNSITVNDGIPPEILYSAYMRPEIYSEHTAINQYIQDESNYDDLSRMFQQVSIIEMQHLDKLGDLITKLGGVKNQYWDNSYIITPSSRTEQLQNAIDGEVTTIKNYETIIEALQGLNYSESRDLLIETIKVIIEDEKVHLKAFTDALIDGESIEEDLNSGFINLQ